MINDSYTLTLKGWNKETLWVKKKDESWFASIKVCMDKKEPRKTDDSSQ